jgi:hypothetical protein
MAVGTQSAQATYAATGGNGGIGLSGAAAGAGAAVSVSNAVSGRTVGGTLVLQQSATGGDGGSSDTGAGGKGGAATSSLTFDDATVNSTQSNSISARVIATGGNGGPNGTGVRPMGGNASATGSITGAGSASVSSEADSQGGLTSQTAGGSATSIATATTGTGLANAYASSVGGRGNLHGGNASATATGNGGSGSVTADAQTQVGVAHPATAILAAETKASATVSTAAMAQATLQYGNTAMAFVTTPQAVANAELAPAVSSSAVAGVLKANSAIAAAFTGAKQFYAVGELGAGHATGGADTETSTAQLSLAIDQTKVPTGGHLVVGLFGGVSAGGSVTSVSLSVTENGASVAALSFANDSADQARAAFSNMGFDLGALSGTGTLTLGFQLSVTSGGAGSGFYGGVIVGDPPARSSELLPLSHWHH